MKTQQKRLAIKTKKIVNNMLVSNEADKNPTNSINGYIL